MICCIMSQEQTQLQDLIKVREGLNKALYNINTQLHDLNEQILGLSKVIVSQCDHQFELDYGNFEPCGPSWYQCKFCGYSQRGMPQKLKK